MWVTSTVLGIARSWLKTKIAHLICLEMSDD